MIDLSRTPVLVGTGQHANRIEDPLADPDPFGFLETVARAAAADSPAISGCGRTALAMAGTAGSESRSVQISSGEPQGSARIQGG